MLRISYSKLGLFHYYEQTGLTLNDFLNKYLRLEPPSEPMRVGIAFHEQLESMITGEPTTSPYRFEQTSMEIPKPDVVEIPLQREVEVKGLKFLFTGRADAIRGHTIYDWKTGFYQIDLEKYFDSYQWRSYLFMNSKARHFRYDCFQLHRPRNTAGTFTLKEHRIVIFHRYRKLEEDVYQELSRYLYFMRELEKQGLFIITPKAVEEGPDLPAYLERHKEET